jgi:formate dehydrogenase major subunit
MSLDGLTRTGNSGPPDSATRNRLQRKARDGLAAATLDRRAFLARAGITAGAALVASELPLNVIQPAQSADPPPAAPKVELKQTICTHCSVGCSVNAVVQDGVWIRQDTAFESPFNMGAHCAKGASVRDHGHGEHRLRYPMKLVDGKYKRISWDQAIEEIGNQFLKIRQESGQDAIFWVGSSKHATSSPISCASSCPCGAPTTWTTRRASATPPPSPASPRLSATAR